MATISMDNDASMLWRSSLRWLKRTALALAYIGGVIITLPIWVVAALMRLCCWMDRR